MKREQIVIVLAPATSASAPNDSAEHDIAALALGLTLAKASRADALALTVTGPLQSASLCQDALTAGCARAVCIRSQRPLELTHSARLLAKFLSDEPPSLIVCGDHYSDHGNVALAGALARLLDWPLLTGVLAAKATSKGLWVRTRSDQGHEELQCQGPVVIAALQRAPAARLAKKAASKPSATVEDISADTLMDDSQSDAPRLRHSGSRHSDFSASTAGVELISEPAELLSRLLMEKLWRP